MKHSVRNAVALAVALAAGSATLVAGAADAPVPAAKTRDMAANSQSAALETQKDRISYSVGIQTGRALRTADGAEVNFDALVRGLKDGLDGSRSQLREKEMAQLLGLFQQSLRQKMSASKGRAKVENAANAAKFLEENKSKPGVVTTATGVQYRILKAGTGPIPTESDAVTVNYRGTLLNGNEFDSTEPGHPANLSVAALIAGWKQILKIMPVGSHWEVYIPPHLAYGERGVGADIGPNELLIFDLELLGTRTSKE